MPIQCGTGRDFEDALLHEAVRQADADALVTRNESDFRAALLAVYEPRELIAIVQACLADPLDE